jgi:hypothetical protein
MSRACDVPADEGEVEQFLGRLDLAHLAPKFREEEVDMRDLRLMTQEDFEKMGVKVGPRVRICDALQRLRKDEKAACSVAVAFRTASSVPVTAQVLPMPTTAPAMPVSVASALAATPLVLTAAAAVLPTPPAAAGSSKTFKSRLQEEVAKRIRPGNADGLPQYATAKNGPDHDPVFEATCSVIVGGVIIRTVGTGKSKKGAEDDAARRALDELGAYTNPIELHFG